MIGTPSLAGLIAFIRSQDPDRSVDNHSWSGCMVGEYAREVLGHEIPVQHEGDYSAVQQDPVIVALWKECGKTRRTSSAELYGIERSDDEDRSSWMDMLSDGAFYTYWGALEYFDEIALLS